MLLFLLFAPDPLRELTALSIPIAKGRKGRKDGREGQAMLRGEGMVGERRETDEGMDRCSLAPPPQGMLPPHRGDPWCDPCSP